MNKKTLSLRTFLLTGLLSFSLACSHQAPTQYQEITTKESVAGYLMVSGWYKDTAVQNKYFKKVGAILKNHGYVTAKFGLPGKNLRVLEGDWVPRPFELIQFETEKNVMDFWNSPEYKNEGLPIRQGYSAIDVIKAGSAYGTKPTLDDQSALLVFYVDITDREKLLRDYVPYAPAFVKRYGGKYLISSDQAGMNLLEGDFPSGSIVIVEFPNSEALNNFWNDEEYKALSEIRKSTGKWSVIEIMPFQR